MPPPDETMPQDGRVSGGPHSATSWVNMIGVPAVVVPAGFYASGLPFGLEFSARPWTDGDLLGIALRVGAGHAAAEAADARRAGTAAVTPARASRGHANWSDYSLGATVAGRGVHARLRMNTCVARSPATDSTHS